MKQSCNLVSPLIHPASCAVMLARTQTIFHPQPSMTSPCISGVSAFFKHCRGGASVASTRSSTFSSGAAGCGSAKTTFLTLFPLRQLFFVVVVAESASTSKWIPRSSLPCPVGAWETWRFFVSSHSPLCPVSFVFFFIMLVIIICVRRARLARMMRHDHLYHHDHPTYVVTYQPGYQQVVSPPPPNVYYSSPGVAPVPQYAPAPQPFPVYQDAPANAQQNAHSVNVQSEFDKQDPSAPLVYGK